MSTKPTASRQGRSRSQPRARSPSDSSPAPSLAALAPIVLTSTTSDEPKKRLIQSKLTGSKATAASAQDTPGKEEEEAIVDLTQALSEPSSREKPKETVPSAAHATAGQTGPKSVSRSRVVSSDSEDDEPTHPAATEPPKKSLPHAVPPAPDAPKAEKPKPAPAQAAAKPAVPLPTPPASSIPSGRPPAVPRRASTPPLQAPVAPTQSPVIFTQDPEVLAQALRPMMDRESARLQHFCADVKNQLAEFTVDARKRLNDNIEGANRVFQELGEDVLNALSGVRSLEDRVRAKEDHLAAIITRAQLLPSREGRDSAKQPREADVAEAKAEVEATTAPTAELSVPQAQEGAANRKPSKPTKPTPLSVGFVTPARAAGYDAEADGALDVDYEPDLRGSSTEDESYQPSESNDSDTHASLARHDSDTSDVSGDDIVPIPRKSKRAKQAVEEADGDEKPAMQSPQEVRVPVDTCTCSPGNSGLSG